MKKRLFASPRWTEYQNVKLTNIKIERTKEDEKKAKKFREFVDKKNNEKL